MAERTLITKDQLEALASKLDTLDLDDEERLVLHAVFAAAGPEADVAGYSIVYQHPAHISEGFLNVFQPGGKVGFGPGGTQASIDIGGGVHI